MFELTGKRDASDQDHVERVLTVIWVGFNSTPNRRGPLIQSPEGGQLPWGHHGEVNSSLRNKKPGDYAEAKVVTCALLHLHKLTSLIILTRLSAVQPV